MATSYSPYTQAAPTTSYHGLKKPFSGRILQTFGTPHNDMFAGSSRVSQVFGDVLKSGQIAEINARAPFGSNSGTYRTLDDYLAAKAKYESDQAAADAANAGKPVEFTVTKTVKQPEIATATGNLLQAQQQQSAQTATGFQDFLKQSRELNEQNRVQLAKDQAAFDTTAISQTLPKNDLAYQTKQNEITGGMVNRNKDFAAQTQDVLNRLTGENQTYEKNAQAVADRAYALAMKRNSLYQLGSGTPTSGSGNLTNRYLKAYAAINVPLQRELADRRYSQITNIERPYQQQLYGNDMAVLNRESGLASDFAGRAESTAKFLQNLQMQTAGMSRQQAQSYLTQLGIPLEIGARIIAGDIANLGGIQKLDELANYYTVQTPFDASRLPEIASFPVTYPRRTYTPGYGSDLPTTTNPVAVAPTSTGSYGGANMDGSPRTNALAPDYSSWRTAPLLAARNRAPVTLPVSTYRPNGDYYGYPAGSSFAPTTGEWRIE